MSRLNACIYSFFMDNIDMKTVQLQKEVVEKYNKNKYPHYILQVDCPPGIAMDYFWALNGNVPANMVQYGVKQQLDHDIVFFLDIDAVPLCDDAIDYYINAAAEGKVVGNAQRSNHIENNQHVFAAPSAVALSRETFIKMGMPSAYPNDRGDVSEEYTFCAEERDIKVDILMPLRYDKAPERYEWEKNQPPYWALADGMPVYGIGTTYGKDDKELVYHNFQIRIPGQQERFWEKCESLLNN